VARALNEDLYQVGEEGRGPSPVRLKSGIRREGRGELVEEFIPRNGGSNKRVIKVLFFFP
jgi:hypothetical protein